MEPGKRRGAGEDPEPRRQSPLRILVFGGCLLLSFATVLTGILRALEAAELGKPRTVLNVVDVTRRRLPALRDGRAPGAARVAFLGDSTTISYPHGRTIPDRLEAALAREERAPVEIHSLAISGIGPFEYYFLIEEIMAARPHAVVFAFNLDTLSQAWRGNNSRPELAGWVEPARLGEALALPLHWIGLTVDRLFFYMSIVRAGAFEAWQELTLEQARMGRAQDALRHHLGELCSGNPELAFDEALDTNTLALLCLPGSDNRRFSERGQLEHHGDALAGIGPEHPVLRVFAATLERLRDGGIPVLVYLAPANVEHMGRLGIFDGPGLASTIAAVETVARSAGADFADLHDLFPDETFRDASGHLAYDGAIDGPAAVAEALAPRVPALLEHSPEARD
ncbi:MAG: hypothetical protein JRG96_16030 [Deltaproteobacteria bacterium]|nr:hypothetical protein [Deltaproteobacteria bacterium]MBW2418459.1 hypothetical protein [Deltaproteobacteria bacterium]